jgi:hypothetical protein
LGPKGETIARSERRFSHSADRYDCSSNSVFKNPIAIDKMALKSTIAMIGSRNSGKSGFIEERYKASRLVEW